MLEESAGSSVVDAPLPIARFLRTSVRMAAALAEYHERDMVHGHLSPRCIVFDPETGVASITNVDVTGLRGGRRDLVHATDPWIYLSPEQTGRLGRPVDARSDLYTLGIILYERLVGALPFQAADALEWAHSHVAKSPRPPTALVPTLPATVSQIVLKVLAKDPDDRYQTARGLERDLEKCLDDWETTGEIVPFSLGEHDHPERLIVPQKLYGRELEQRELLRAFTNIVEDERSRLVLLAGGPGVGKTALVRELAKPIAAANGFFISGKFDQFHRDVPYAPIVRAFRDLARLILAASEAKVAVWRQRLLNAVGINGRLIIDLLPEVEIVIGEQPPVTPMPPIEAHHRFATVFRRFVRVFATAERPLALFLDDLQWADAASLRLLADVMTHSSVRSLLVVGAYRDHELDAAHPLVPILDEMRGAGVIIESLKLDPLPVEPLCQFLADTLHSEPAQCEPLARAVWDKTHGNPFFFTQFLATLHRTKLLRLDRKTHAWTWDTERILAQAFSDNVVDLLAAHFRDCAPEIQYALSLAACLGNSFDPEILVAVGARSDEQMGRALGQAVQQGLILKTPDGYAFVHDRVQQAAYALISEQARASTHLAIGRILLARTPAEELRDRVFDLLSHLNRGTSTLKDRDERERVAHLNLLAARRARASAAFGAAADYCACGLLLLDRDAWSTQYELAFSLSRASAECELAAGNLDEAERRLGPPRAHARTRADRTACWRIQIDLHTARGQSLEALNAAFECLRLYDLDLVVHPSREQVETAERAMWARLGDHPIEALHDLPLMHEDDIGAAVDVLAGTLPSAYFADAQLHRLIACLIVDMTFRYGLCPMSPMGVAAYGFELAIMVRYAEADRFGRAALSAVERHGFVACRAKVMNLLGATITFWTHGLHSSIDWLREGVRAGVESGDAIFACLNQVYISIFSFATGAPLDEIDREAERAVDFIRAAGYAPLADGGLILQRVVGSLSGRHGGESNLAGPDFDAFVQRMTAHPMPPMATWLHGLVLEGRVFLGDTAGAIASAAALRPLIVRLRGQLAEASAAFYVPLAITAAWDEASPDVQRAWELELDDYDARMRILAASCPESFEHRSALVSAEVSRVRGRREEVPGLYDRAIRGARKYGYVQIEALAHERAAHCFRKAGLEATADLHLREARASYLRWGALAKVRKLEAEWPALSASETRPTLAPPSSGGLDALAVVKASQAISGEIVLDRLLEKLLRVVMEEAGARHGALLLVRSGGLFVAATAAVQGESIDVTVCEPFVALSADALPASVIHYVRRTREPLIVPDASKDETFASDPHIVRQQVKAILCMPVVRQAELLGVLYLDNDLIANAFTPERLSVLAVLVAQVAISLENATLYADLRREIAERQRSEEELRLSQAELRQAQKMEAVGRLAGGIAHDFNNLLTAIGGYSMFAIERLPPDDPIRKDIEEIQKAGERAAALTRQLLAFSRRQVLAPAPVNLNDVVANLDKMLRRLIGEDIELVCQKFPDLGIVKVDPGQMEQILLNLAVNARDAMPRGGRLTIETANQELDGRFAREDDTMRAGSYVLLAVSDTGEGMDAETQARIFEPFFTTKEQGKGTGLGLSTVYGIVKQSEGHIEVQSELGRGTSFKVYLPRTDELAVPIARSESRTPVPRGNETILVVEDEESVRNLARDVLAGLGYRVLAAADGPSALRLQAREHRPIHLLISDVVMPRMNGPELAKRLLPLVPGMEVLFLSGYTADAVVQQDIVQSEAAFLQKPFTPDSLARKTRAILDRGAISNRGAGE